MQGRLPSAVERGYSYGFPIKRLTVCPTSRKFRIVLKGLVGTSATAMFSSNVVRERAKIFKVLYSTSWP